jgi:hypothetical protein
MLTRRDISEDDKKHLLTASKQDVDNKNMQGMTFREQNRNILIQATNIPHDLQLLYSLMSSPNPFSSVFDCLPFPFTTAVITKETPEFLHKQR